MKNEILSRNFDPPPRPKSFVPPACPKQNISNLIQDKGSKSSLAKESRRSSGVLPDTNNLSICPKHTLPPHPKMKSWNKKATPISNLIFFFLAVIVLLLALTYFIVWKGDKKDIVNNQEILDSFYRDIDYLDFYLQRVFDKSVEGFKGDKEDFINKFKENLNFYKSSDGSYFVRGLDEVEEYVNSEGFVDNIEISSDRLVLRVEIGLEKDGSGILLKYGYERSFKEGF